MSLRLRCNQQGKNDLFPQRSVIIQFARIVVLAAATLAIFGACSSTESGRTAPATITKSAFTLMANDDGRSITLAIGQELIVRLAGNATTGYRWTLADAGNNVLEQQGKPDYVMDAAPGGRVGVGGTEIWRFKAVRNGQQTLQFEYRRSWEKGLAPVRTASYAITVQ